MTDAVGIRLDKETLKAVDRLGEEESTDRSTIIRKLLKKGFEEYHKERAAQAYREGKVTLTEAAHRAGISLWDFQHYMVDKGFVSSYSIEDMMDEVHVLGR